VLREDPNGYVFQELDDILNPFLREWANELEVDVVHHSSHGTIKRILKFSTDNP
jgi:hypothetical protein